VHLLGGVFDVCVDRREYVSLWIFLGFGLLVHPPDAVVLDGEEDKIMGICLEKRFGSKMSFGLRGLVLQYFALQWRHFLSFPCGTDGVQAELVPIIAIVPDEVCDLAEGLVHYDVFEQHGRY
jgi:hypothetical protein